MRSLASLAASLCLALSACSAGTCGQPQIDADIALMPFQGNEIVPVAIDGVPVGLILDTGASGLTVTPQAVADLNLTVQPIPYRVTAIGGTRSNSLTEIPDLNVGGARLSRAAAVVSPPASATTPPTDCSVRTSSPTGTSISTPRTMTSGSIIPSNAPPPPRPGADPQPRSTFGPAAATSVSPSSSTAAR